MNIFGKRQGLRKVFDTQAWMHDVFYKGLPINEIKKHKTVIDRKVKWMICSMCRSWILSTVLLKNSCIYKQYRERKYGVRWALIIGVFEILPNPSLMFLTSEIVK